VLEPFDQQRTRTWLCYGRLAAPPTTERCKPDARPCSRLTLSERERGIHAIVEQNSALRHRVIFVILKRGVREGLHLQRREETEIRDRETERETTNQNEALSEKFLTERLFIAIERQDNIWRRPMRGALCRAIDPLGGGACLCWRWERTRQ
jgi:hypothetical protein